MTTVQQVLQAVYPYARLLQDKGESISAWLLVPTPQGWDVESRETGRYSVLEAPYLTQPYDTREEAEKTILRLIEFGTIEYLALRTQIWEANRDALAASPDMPSDDQNLGITE